MQKAGFLTMQLMIQRVDNGYEGILMGNRAKIRKILNHSFALLIVIFNLQILFDEKKTYMYVYTFFGL